MKLYIWAAIGRFVKKSVTTLLISVIGFTTYVSRVDGASVFVMLTSGPSLEAQEGVDPVATSHNLLKVTEKALLQIPNKLEI